MKIDVFVPEGKSNEWEVKKYTVSEIDVKKQLLHSVRRYVPQGTYTKLMRDGVIIMSNTPDEIRDFIRVKGIRKAKGHILINGLGLGVVVQYLLDNNEVTKITVIEKSADVIKLVAPTYLRDKRVEILHADCFTYKPPKNVKYDFVWHDIWDGICSDNVEEMKKLHRKYGRKTKAQASWCRSECEVLLEKEKKFFAYF